MSRRTSPTGDYGALVIVSKRMLRYSHPKCIHASQSNILETSLHRSVPALIVVPRVASIRPLTTRDATVTAQRALPTGTSVDTVDPVPTVVDSETPFSSRGDPERGTGVIEGVGPGLAWFKGLLGEGRRIGCDETHVRVGVHGETVVAPEEVAPCREGLEAVVDGEVGAFARSSTGDVAEDFVHFKVAANRREVTSK